MTAEPSMGWMEFAHKVEMLAHCLNDSNCPMVFILPDGKEVRFNDVKVELAPIEVKRGDSVCLSYEYHVELLAKSAEAPCK